jgi:hypothetical protein
LATAANVRFVYVLTHRRGGQTLSTRELSGIGFVCFLRRWVVNKRLWFPLAFRRREEWLEWQGIFGENKKRRWEKKSCPLSFFRRKFPNLFSNQI